MTERKIVINRCFGGFGLSAAGVRRYTELKGLPLWIEQNPEMRSLTDYWIVPPEQRPAPINWKTATKEERRAYDAAITAAQVYDRDIPRDDADLVRAVEELGDQADGEFAKLCVVSIPADVSWELDDYDGREIVREVHRSWS